MKINNSFPSALPLLLPHHQLINFYQVGAGGTGSFLAPALVRLMLALESTGQPCTLTIIDFDTVEEKNIPRQNFVAPEIAFNKAEVLASRYSLAFGVSIKAIANYFHGNMLDFTYNSLNVIIGCVDSATGRKEIAEAMGKWSNDDYSSRFWWLDCGNFGNGMSSGQVLLGSTNHFDWKQYYQEGKPLNFLSHLPSPSQQHPELIEDNAVVKLQLSCAESSRENAQALFINQRVAVEAVEMLNQLLLTHNLRRYATYFNCLTGTSTSEYISAQSLSKFA